MFEILQPALLMKTLFLLLRFLFCVLKTLLQIVQLADLFPIDQEDDQPDDEIADKTDSDHDQDLGEGVDPFQIQSHGLKEDLDDQIMC